MKLYKGSTVSLAQQSAFWLQRAALLSPFLPVCRGDLVTSAADANKCVSLISGQNILSSPP